MRRILVENARRKLRYFVGLSLIDAAEAPGISLRTADRGWAYARAWLHRELSQQ